jgi:protease I
MISKGKAKKLLMIVGDFAEDYEVMVPFQALQIVGHEVHAVCPDKKKGDKIITAVHQMEQYQTYTESNGHFFELNYSFDSVKADDYDGLVLPGGRAPEYLKMNPNVIKICQHFLDSDKPIAAVCHGISILTLLNNIKGRTMTCFPTVMFEVKFAGAVYQEAKFEEAVVDKNIVTAVAWTGHVEWLRKFLEVLEK